MASVVEKLYINQFLLLVSIISDRSEQIIKLYHKLYIPRTYTIYGFISIILGQWSSHIIVLVFYYKHVRIKHVIYVLQNVMLLNKPVYWYLSHTMNRKWSDMFKNLEIIVTTL